MRERPPIESMMKKDIENRVPNLSSITVASMTAGIAARLLTIGIKLYWKLVNWNLAMIYTCNVTGFTRAKSLIIDSLAS